MILSNVRCANFKGVVVTEYQLATGEDVVVPVTMKIMIPNNVTSYAIT